MFVTIPQGIEVKLDADSGTLSLGSNVCAPVMRLAHDYAARAGMRKVGAVRITTCDITPAPHNLEEGFGVPSAYRMFLVQHQDLMHAGGREPFTVTVFRTTVQTEDHHGDLQQDYYYHFNIGLS